MANSISLCDIDALVKRPINEIRSWFKVKIQQIVVHGKPTALVVEPCMTSTGSMTYRVISELKADRVIATGLIEEMDPYDADSLFKDSVRAIVAKQDEVMFKGLELPGRHLEYGGVETLDGGSLECVPLEELLPEHVDADLVCTYARLADRPRRYFIPRTPHVEEILAECPDWWSA